MGARPAKRCCQDYAVRACPGPAKWWQTVQASKNEACHVEEVTGRAPVRVNGKRVGRFRRRSRLSVRK